MFRALIVVTTALLLSAAPTLVSATEEGAAAGAVTGAVAGAVVGGPIGAVIGAVVGGAVVGTATGPSTLANAQIEEPSPLLQQRGMVQRQVRHRGGRVVQEPETTGSVVETTCVRDARGNTRCRREFVR